MTLDCVKLLPSKTLVVASHAYSPSTIPFHSIPLRFILLHSTPFLSCSSAQQNGNSSVASTCIQHQPGMDHSSASFSFSEPSALCLHVTMLQNQAMRALNWCRVGQSRYQPVSISSHHITVKVVASWWRISLLQISRTCCSHVFILWVFNTLLLTPLPLWALENPLAQVSISVFDSVDCVCSACNVTVCTCPSWCKSRPTWLYRCLCGHSAHSISFASAATLDRVLLCTVIWKPGGGFIDSLFGIDTSLGDAWVLNPIDFASGNPSTSPGTVIIRPQVTYQDGLHVEFSLTCLGCASLVRPEWQSVAGPIDKSHPTHQLGKIPAPQSIYNYNNYNPQTTSAVQSIPLFQQAGVTVACSNCYLALLQAGLFLAVDYNTAGGVGFQTIQIEADASLLANLDLTLTSDGTQDSSYANPLATDRVLFDMPFTVAGITFRATIEANLTALVTVKGSGSMSVTAGKNKGQKVVSLMSC